jgi:hypothetical protein
VHLLHLGLGTLQVVWALVFFCVSLLFDASSFAVMCVLGEVDRLCSSLPCSTLSWFSSNIVVYGLRENETSFAYSSFGSRQSL